MTQFRHFDTKRPDGCYVTFTKLTHDDTESSPHDWMDDQEDMDVARLDAWHAGEWCLIGIQAEAEIIIVRGGTAIGHTLRSGGLWSVESDSDADYLASVYAEECEALLADIAMLGKGVIVERPA